MIYDSGHTQPMVHLPSNQQLQATPDKNHQVNFPRVPVVTPSMSPGKVFSRSIHHPYLSNPIFIVGYDMISLSWLQKHKEKLKQNHAIGIVVRDKKHIFYTVRKKRHAFFNDGDSHNTGKPKAA